MNLSRTIIFNSLRFHARGHLGTLLGVIVAAAVLVGALAIGDSVRDSLRDLNAARLGTIDLALSSKDRFFRAQLADDLQVRLPAHSQTAAALHLPASASRPDQTARANQVQVLGVNEQFWALALKKPALNPHASDSVILSRALAEQLNVTLGETIVLRVQKPSFTSSEAPISPREDVTAGLRLSVTAIVSDAEFGRFSLQANQVAPFNAFVPLSCLQEKLGLHNKANLLLVGSRGAESVDLTHAASTLKHAWKLADAGLELRSLSEGWELRSQRVFLDPAVVQAVRKLAPQAQLISTYFVNELRAGERSTPYSMVTATGAPLVPAEMDDNEILVNTWLAEDLALKPGDALRLSWLALGTRGLEERQQSFKVRNILPMEGAAADRTLMPEFPGLAKAEKTENWDAGFAIDMGKIRTKDEEYWRQFRGTPKAFITFKAGRQMWGNRFGEVTAIRFSIPRATPEQIEADLCAALDPSAIGFSFSPVRQQAAAASDQSQDFSQLFLGFSFFLITAALILVGLLFQFGLEKRTTETGVLLALGLRPQQVRRLLLVEGSALALIGSIAGLAGGLLYARIILYGLGTLWRDAVGTSALALHVHGSTLLTGGIVSLLICWTVIFFSVRKQTQRAARELLDQGSELEFSEPSQTRCWDLWIFACSGLAAVALVIYAAGQGNTGNAQAFFGAGALTLIAGLAAITAGLRRGRSSGQALPNIASLSWRGCARRRKRSLATIALLASGCFLIVAVESNKLDAARGADQRPSGTGGFALLASSAVPIVQDLNADLGRGFYGLRREDLPDTSFVPFRVREGDDASCLNLNRAQKPRLLGVAPNSLDARRAFTFANLENESFRSHPWLSLETQNINEIPAIADQASITWALGKKIGDTLDFIDERGQPFKVRLVGGLAGSILQGSLLISETEFVKRFPGESGYRLFLIDVPPQAATAVAANLSRALQDVGLEVTPTIQRLNALNAVQNTYLNTFQVLGALGLLLGSVGLGIVLLRNILERRGELALLMALGFSRARLQSLLLLEHTLLLALGLALGLFAAILAILPVWLRPESQVRFIFLAFTLSLICLAALFSVFLATRLAIRGRLLDALRNE